jgi:hypothetical protein
LEDLGTNLKKENVRRKRCQLRMKGKKKMKSVFYFLFILKKEIENFGVATTKLDLKLFANKAKMGWSIANKNKKYCVLYKDQEQTKCDSICHKKILFKCLNLCFLNHFI